MNKDDFLEQVGKQYKTLIESKNGMNITADLRDLSAKLFKQIEVKSLSNVLSICDELLRTDFNAFSIIVFDFAYRMRKVYNEHTFDVFEGWLQKYCTDWDTVDDFCSHAFGELLKQNTKYFQRVVKWTKRDEWWMRRASAVILIPMIRKNTLKYIDCFQISDSLMYDEHYLVLKGYGWMLKEFSKHEPKLIINYLTKHKETMPRTAFRYALEKLDAESKKTLMIKM